MIDTIGIFLLLLTADEVILDNFSCPPLSCSLPALRSVSSYIQHKGKIWRSLKVSVLLCQESITTRTAMQDFSENKTKAWNEEMNMLTSLLVPVVFGIVMIVGLIGNILVITIVSWKLNIVLYYRVFLAAQIIYKDL